MSQVSDTLLRAIALNDSALTQLDDASREPRDSIWHATHLEAFGSLQDDAFKLAAELGIGNVEFLRLYAEYRA